MRETLFFFPHFLFTGPLFWAWLVIGGVILTLMFIRDKGKGFEFLPFYLVVAGLIRFVLPALEVQGIDIENPEGPLVPLGIAVRGYGFFLLLGMVSGIGIVCLRARKFGISVEHILSLTFTMVVCGIVGARLFYVIQKFDSFQHDSLVEFLKHAVDMTEGGLVVYGSLIGGLLGATVYLMRYKLPVLLTADLLAPGMVLGLALGRLGCLMNGCCFGGVCEVDNLPTITFPVGSPPYMTQLAEGELFGMKLSNADNPLFEHRVDRVRAGSEAEKAGVKEGDLLNIQFPDNRMLRAAKWDDLEVDAEVILQFRHQENEKNRPDIEVASIPVEKIPNRSNPVHPTQVYSSVNAFLMCLFLWFYFPYRKADGEVFAIMLTVYSVARYLLETIRTDEAGQFGTAFTISQWISFFVLASGIGLFLFLRKTKPLSRERAQTA